MFWKQSDSSLLVSCCCNSEYQRYFQLDDANLKYYLGAQDKDIKKKLGLQGATAQLESYNQRAAAKGKADRWHVEESQYRVGIKLAQRKGPIYFYSNSLHDSKVLVHTIKTLTDPDFSRTVGTLVNSASAANEVHTASRILNLLTSAAEKRNV